MVAKEKEKVSKIALILSTIMLIIIFIYTRFVSDKETYATDKTDIKTAELNISNAKTIDLDSIIQKNAKGRNGKE